MKSAAAVSLPRVPTAHRPRKAAERAVRLAEKAKRKDGKDRARGSKSDGSGYLTMYFRDMAALHVLRPEEEFTTAKEIEALEVAVWTALLGWAPALTAPGLGVTPEATRLERFTTARRRKSTISV